MKAKNKIIGGGLATLGAILGLGYLINQNEPGVSQDLAVDSTNYLASEVESAWTQANFPQDAYHFSKDVSREVAMGRVDQNTIDHYTKRHVGKPERRVESDLKRRVVEIDGVKAYDSNRDGLNVVGFATAGGLLGLLGYAAFRKKK